MPATKDTKRNLDVLKDKLEHMAFIVKMCRENPERMPEEDVKAIAESVDCLQNSSTMQTNLSLHYCIHVVTAFAARAMSVNIEQGILYVLHSGEAQNLKGSLTSLLRWNSEPAPPAPHVLRAYTCFVRIHATCYVYMLCHGDLISNIGDAAHRGLRFWAAHGVGNRWAPLGLTSDPDLLRRRFGLPGPRGPHKLSGLLRASGPPVCLGSVSDPRAPMGLRGGSESRAPLSELPGSLGPGLTCDSDSRAPMGITSTPGSQATLGPR